MPKPSAYHIYVKTKISVDFQICISVPVTFSRGNPMWQNLEKYCNTWHIFSKFQRLFFWNCKYVKRLTQNNRAATHKNRKSPFWIFLIISFEPQNWNTRTRKMLYLYFYVFFIPIFFVYLVLRLKFFKISVFSYQLDLQLMSHVLTCI